MPPAGGAEAMDLIKAIRSEGHGMSVYEHLKVALMQVLKSRPEAALQLFECTFLESRAFAKQPEHAPDATQVAQHAAAATGSLHLYGEFDPVLEDGQAAEEQPEADEYAFFEPEAPEALLVQLQRAGAGLSEGERVEVMLAMSRLGGVADRKVEALRFFGKFFNLRGSYYVFECRMNERPEKEAEPEEEPGRGIVPPPEAEAGCNKYMYFVCSHLGGPFTLLDDVRPEQIRAARNAPKLLSGALDAPLAVFPPFPGAERHYLRAQIARIAHATKLCPRGLFTPPDDDGAEPDLNEEYSPLPLAAMHDPANWCHREAHVKALGVTVLPDVPEPDEDDPVEVHPEQVEQGPPRLQPADVDGAVQGMAAWAPLWSSCSYSVQHQVAGVRSLAWPGAVALTDGGSWSNVYVGWGLKRGTECPYPRAPAMQQDPAPAAEQSGMPPPPPEPEAEEDA